MNAPQHNAEPTKQFFDRWHLYQQIIDNDYMAHRGIHAAIQKFVIAHINKPFTLLDLGCGDASAIPATFANTNLQAYTGVDLSSVALSQAAQNLAAETFQVNLVEADFTHYLHDDFGCFNVILAGFTLHHLYPEEKREFFQRCYAGLEPSGYLLLYDVFRRPAETRDQYMQAYCGHCSEHWNQLSPEGLGHIIEHAHECDFPETHETLAAMASAAGFIPAPAPLFTDALQFHCLYVFQTQLVQPVLTGEVLNAAV